MKIRFSIRTLLFTAIVAFVTFVAGNQVVDQRLANLPLHLSFDSVKDIYGNPETPKPLSTEIEMYHSLSDYFLFRRRVKFISNVELVYGGPYGGGFTHRMPGAPNRFVKCEHMFRVNLFSSELVSQNYIGLDSSVWIVKEDGQYPIVNGKIP